MCFSHKPSIVRIQVQSVTLFSKVSQTPPFWPRYVEMYPWVNADSEGPDQTAHPRNLIRWMRSLIRGIRSICSPLTDLLSVVEENDVKQNFPINPCPAEPRYALPLQIV